MSDIREIKQTILAEIATHLRVHGPRHYHLIRDRYPDIIGGGPGSNQERNFYRWLKLVQSKPGAVPEHLKEAVKEAKSFVGRNLPAAIPPEYVARVGGRARKQLDLLEEVHEIYGDVQIIREWSSKVDEETGARSVKNPVYFDMSIKRRIEVLETMLKIQQEVWDLKRMQDFFQEVVNIIAEEILPLDQDVALAIMQRLQRLNDEQGMTVHAQPGRA